MLMTPKQKNKIQKKVIEIKKAHRRKNAIRSIKVFNKIHVRFDKLMTSYIEFVYLAA